MTKEPSAASDTKDLETITPASNGTDASITIQRTQQVQRREAWVGWTQVLANILVPLALVFAGLTLLQQSWQGQQDAAARQVELFYSEGLSNAQTRLFSLWSDTDLDVLRTPQKREFIDTFVSKTIAISEINSNQISASIAALTAYFDRVEACVQSEVCDEAEIMSHVGAYGRDFYCIYAGQISEIQIKTLASNLGKGLQSFAERSGGCGDNKNS